MVIEREEAVSTRADQVFGVFNYHRLAYVNFGRAG